MKLFKVGDIVEYIDDWKKGRHWIINSLDSNNKCTIVLLREDGFTHTKTFSSAGHTWTETYLNSNIVNLDIERIKNI